MKKQKVLFTTLISFASVLAVVFCVLLSLYFTRNTYPYKPQLSDLNAAAPTGNWVDYAVKPATGSGTQASPWADIMMELSQMRFPLLRYVKLITKITHHTD